MYSLSLSLRFDGHFPGGGPGLAGTRMSPFWILLELRVMEVVLTTGAIRRAKFQSKCHHQQTNIQLFYKPDALPVAQPTLSKHWRERDCNRTKKILNNLQPWNILMAKQDWVLKVKSTVKERTTRIWESTAIWCWATVKRPSNQSWISVVTMPCLPEGFRAFLNANVP